MSFLSLVTVVTATVALTFAAALPMPGSTELGDLELFKAGAHQPETCVPASAPTRVASVALAADEMLLELLPLSKLLAVSYVADWPSATPVSERFPKTMPRLSGTAEQILWSRPDLVVISDYNRGGMAAQLASAGVCVARLPAPRTFDDVLGAFARLGEWTHEGEVAAASAHALRDEIGRIAELGRGARPRRALVLQGSNAYGSGTLQDDCIRLAGFTNAAAALAGTPTLSAEHILGLDPDVVFLSTDTAAARAARSERLSPAIPWRALRARRLGAVFEVPSSWVGSMSHHALRACRAYAETKRRMP